MSGAYDQYVSQVYCLLEKYGNKKNMKKFEQKIKCIVQEAFHLSRRNSEQPFLPASPAEWMSLFYNDTCVTKKFIRNCDRVFFPCKLSSNEKLHLLNIFNFFSQLPGLTEECFKKFIATLTDSPFEDKEQLRAFLKKKITDIMGDLSCGGNNKIVTNITDATDKPEVVVLYKNNNLDAFIKSTSGDHFFVLQSVYADGNQEAIDYTKYAVDKAGVGIYGKVTLKNKQTFTTSVSVKEISEKTTGPKPLSISSLAVKNRRTLICKLLGGGVGGRATGSGSGGGSGGKGGSGIGGGGGGATGSGSGSGGGGIGGGGIGGGGGKDGPGDSGAGGASNGDTSDGNSGGTGASNANTELQKIIDVIISINNQNFFYLNTLASNTGYLFNAVPLVSTKIIDKQIYLNNTNLNINTKLLNNNYFYFKFSNNEIYSFDIHGKDQENLYNEIVDILEVENSTPSSVNFLNAFKKYNIERIL